MPDYRAMYFRLAGRVADAIDLLVEAQREGEEMAMKETAAALELDAAVEDGEPLLE